jgi:hypothetical protein
LEGLFPEELDGAQGLGGGLPGDLLLGLEMEEVLAQVLGGDELGGLLEMIAEFADAVPVTQDGALAQGQETQVIVEAI